MKKCLKPIFSFEKEKEVIVVDNNSQDNSLDIISQFPVKLIQNQKNLGYTRGINQGINGSSGDIIVFLSPSTYIEKDFIERLENFFDVHPEADAVGFKVIDKNGKIYPSIRAFPDIWGLIFQTSGLAKVFPSHRIFGRWRQLYFDYGKEQEADQPMGAAFAIKRDILNRTNGMDERFFLYFSDVDLCKRIKENGGKIFYTPKITVMHPEGGLTKKMEIRRIRIMHRDMLKYFKKYSTPYVFLFSAFLIIISGEIRVLVEKIRKTGESI